MISRATPTKRKKKADRHPDRDEEEVEEEAFVGVDDRLDLVIVLRAGEEHSERECTKRHGEARQVHEVGRADHRKEDEPGEGLPVVPAQEKIGEAGKDELANHGDHGEAPKAETDFLQPERFRRAPCRQERHHGKQGDDREVLEKEHAQGHLSVPGLQLAALAEDWQDEGSRGESEAKSEDEGRLPGGTDELKDRRQNDSDPDDLGRSEAENHSLQFPEPPRIHLQADLEEEENDSELREFPECAALATDVEHGGSDDDPREDEAENRPEPEARGQRGGQEGHSEKNGGEVDEFVDVHEGIGGGFGGGDSPRGGSFRSPRAGKGLARAGESGILRPRGNGGREARGQ